LNKYHFRILNSKNIVAFEKYSLVEIVIETKQMLMFIVVMTTETFVLK